MATKKKSYAQTVGGFGNVPGITKLPKPTTNFAPKVPTFKPVAPPTTKFDVNNLPVDAGYDKTIGGLTRTRDDTIAGGEGDKTRTLTDYGYGATYDAKGDVASLTFDPKNPFSRAALLRKHYGESKAGTTNSMAARGQLYSGALVNAQNANDSNYLQSDNDLQKGLGGILAGIIGRQRTAGSDYETGAGTAFGDRVTRAQNNPNYNPTTGDITGLLPPPAAPAPAPVSPLSAKTLSAIDKWRTQGTDYRKKKK